MKNSHWTRKYFTGETPQPQ